MYSCRLVVEVVVVVQLEVVTSVVALTNVVTLDIVQEEQQQPEEEQQQERQEQQQQENVAEKSLEIAGQILRPRKENLGNLGLQQHELSHRNNKRKQQRNVESR